MAKLYASEMANRVADRAVQIFGGRGYMREKCRRAFSTRELRVDRIWEGASEIQRLIIANGLSQARASRFGGIALLLSRHPGAPVRECGHSSRGRRDPRLGYRSVEKAWIPDQVPG